ncbi:steroid 21-hydroxylase [Scyliorhinus torazame]|uniref:steroid 21-hydroxylase n=1 Tax=Scyliorhinus torazame TaxID=75743 RepID=UPI003B5C227D
MITIFLLSFISLFIALKIWRRERFQKQRSGQQLPGPPLLPLIGNLQDLRQQNLHIHLTKLAKRFGPIYRLRTWKQEIVVLNSVELIKEALVKGPSDLAGRPQTFIGNFISFGGKDLALGDYTSTWKIQKKLVHGVIQRSRNMALEPLVEREARKLCETFQSYVGMPVDTTRDFSMSTCNVISSLTFGTEYEKNDPELQDIHDCLVELVSLWGSPSISLLDMFPILQHFPNSAWKDFQKAVGKRDTFIRRQIERHKETFQKGKVRDTTDALMKYFWDQEEETAELGEVTEEHIHMAIVDLFVGGTETTSSTLSWAIALLIQRPDIQDRIYGEMCNLVGEDRYPTYAERRNLPLLSATIAEVLRLRPVVPLSLLHRATCDKSVAGYFVQKGTNVIINLFGAHQDECKWTDPAHFRPERFLESADGEQNLQSVISFGAGARTCLGEPVARVELFIFMAYLLKNFQFLPVKDVHHPALRTQPGILLKMNMSPIQMPAIALAALYLSALVSARTSIQYHSFSAGVTKDEHSKPQSWLMELLPWPWLQGHLNGEKLESRGVSKKWVLGTQAEDVKEQAAGVSVRVPLTKKQVEMEEDEAPFGGTLDAEGLANEEKIVQPLTSIAGRLQSFTRTKGGIGFRFGK